MIDIVIPQGNEKAFGRMAERLGYDGVCFLYTAQADKEARLFAGLDKRIKGARFFILRARHDLRRQIEREKPDILIGCESLEPHDSPTHRKGGLDDVVLKLARGRNVAIGFSVESIISGGPRILGRVRMNIELCRKQKVRMAIASFATNPESMRSPADLKSLFITLGMHPKEAQDALELPARLLKSQN
jgi:RNase P/RNase MRP subunit p30